MHNYDIKSRLQYCKRFTKRFEYYKIVLLGSDE